MKTMNSISRSMTFGLTMITVLSLSGSLARADDDKAGETLVEGAAALVAATGAGAGLLHYSFKDFDKHVLGREGHYSAFMAKTRHMSDESTLLDKIEKRSPGARTVPLDADLISKVAWESARGRGEADRFLIYNDVLKRELANTGVIDEKAGTINVDRLRNLTKNRQKRTEAAWAHFQKMSRISALKKASFVGAGALPAGVITYYGSRIINDQSEKPSAPVQLDAESQGDGEGATLTQSAQ